MFHQETPTPGPVKGEFCHEHRGGNNPGIVFQCTGEYECSLCALNRRMWDVKNNLLGEILTIVDAVLTDERQLKATKDLIKNRVIMGFSEHNLSMEMLIGTAMLYPQQYRGEIEQREIKKA